MSRLGPALLLVLGGCPPSGSDAPDDDPPHTDAPDDDQAEAGPEVEVQVGVAVTLTGEGGTSDARWDLGDGTRLDGRTVTHVYERPGNFVATFAATRDDGRPTSDSTRVTAWLPAADPAPVASSTVVIAGGVAWVAVTDADHLAGVDLATHASRLVPACDAPRTVAPAGDRLAVACEGDDALALVDPEDGDVDQVDLGTGARPYGVVVRDGVAWLTAPGLGAAVAVDLDDHDVREVPLGPDPRALVLDPAGDPWATRLRAAQDHGEVLGPDGPLVLPKDPGPDSDTGNRGVLTGVRALALSPDGGSLYVGGTVSNVDRGLWRDGQALSFETSVRGQVRVLRDGVEDVGARRQLDNHGDVSAFALSPRGNWLWLVHLGTGTLIRLDAYTLRTSGSIQDAGRGIDGLALTPDGRTLLVHAALDRELRAFDVSAPDVTPTLLWTAPTVDAEPLSPEVLLGKQLFHDARDTRLARDGYVSCATCHPDGTDDGLVWDFTSRGEGLRNTISLLGRAGTGMGPVHWSGNFDEIQDFENDIRGGQGGTGLLSAADWDEAHDTLGPAKAGRSADLDALAAYVASLDRPPRSPFQAPESGAALFEAEGCAACHPAPLYTDSAPDVRHDVGTIGPGSGGRLGGTLDGLDTPTLLGVHATAPYLHDGSAPTVEDAIRAHVGGESAGLELTEDEVATLAGFVRSL